MKQPVKRLLAIFLIFAPLALWGQEDPAGAEKPTGAEAPSGTEEPGGTAAPPIGVGIIRFSGDTESVNEQFWQEVIDDTKSMDRFNPVKVDLTGDEAAGLPPDEPPPAKWSGDQRYVLTGALYPDPVQQNMQIWLWDLSVPTLVYTDQMVCDNFEDGKEFIGMLVEYVFSQVKEEAADPPDDTAPAAEAPEGEAPAADPPPAETPAPTEDPLPDPWRNKRLYVNLGIGVDSGHFIRQGTAKSAPSLFTPVFLVGLEGHIWKYLALEVDLLRPQSLNSNDDIILSLVFPLLIKGVFRPRDMMVEPYAGAAYELGISPSGISMPPLSVLTGVQLGIRAQENAVWTLDTGFSLSVMGAFEIAGVNYSLMRFHFMVGYKFGFLEMRKPAAPRLIPSAKAGSPQASG